MSRSIKKTKIFGHASSSEKKDKRINNRIFRRRENEISNEILKEERVDNTSFLWSEENQIVDTEAKYPTDMDEVRSTWAMSKDGKAWWNDATKKDMSK